MKRLALFVAVVLAVGACAKTETPKAADTTAAMAPMAPAMTDSSMKADSMKKADAAAAAMKKPETKAASTKKKP